MRCRIWCEWVIRTPVKPNDTSSPSVVYINTQEYLVGTNCCIMQDHSDQCKASWRGNFQNLLIYWQKKPLFKLLKKKNTQAEKTKHLTRTTCAEKHFFFLSLCQRDNFCTRTGCFYLSEIMTTSKITHRFHCQPDHARLYCAVPLMPAKHMNQPENQYTLNHADVRVRLQPPSTQRPNVSFSVWYKDIRGIKKVWRC